MAAKQQTVTKLKPINRERVVITIEGTSPLIHHQWSEKAKQMMRDKKMGKKTKTREACDPSAECEAATYRTEDGQYGVPAMAIKGAMITAAHKDIGIEKTLVKKAVRFREAGTIPMRCSEPRLREDHVRVGMGAADLRYRPEFEKWEVDIDIEYVSDYLTLDDLVNLVNLAGFTVGICEMRPEKGGEFGRFCVKSSD